MIAALLVALPLAAALVIGCLPDDGSRRPAFLAMAATLAAGFCLAVIGPAVVDGGIVAASVPWLPLPGADFGVRVDALAWMFSALVLGIGALVIFYSSYYLRPGDPKPRFFAQLMFFMASMLGILLADNLLLMAMAWELTSIASFLLIGYWQDRPDARRGARMALIVTGDIIRAHPWYLPALVLVLLGAFTKSAQFPFHFWLPDAMAAPTPVSAYLHSATMVKAGVFLLARLYPALAGTDAWFWLVAGTGIVTMLAGAYIAIFQHDLKGLLAYSTISHLGLITFLFGMNRPLAVVAGVFHVINHATFKASLFMASGIIDHETGTRDMRRLAGLWRYMPATAVLAIVAALAMAGVPLLNGFLSKEMFLAETLMLKGNVLVRLGIPLAATLASAFAVAYSTRFVHDVFWNGEPRGLGRRPHDPAGWMLMPVGVLVLLCLLVGIFPNRVIGALLTDSATAALGAAAPDFTLSLWHGLSTPLLMSTVALTLGVILYFSLQRLFRLHDLVHLPRGGRDIYEFGTNGLRAAAGRIIGWFEGTGVQANMRWLVLAALLAVGAVLPGLSGSAGGPVVERAPTSPGVPALVLALLGAAVTIGVVAMYRRRFVAVVLTGAIGLLVSVSFAALSAPDLALTQLLVEGASVILLLLALYYLPARSPAVPVTTAAMLGNGLLAGAAGTAVGALTYAILTRDFDPISAWHLRNAVSGAAGSNAVNVIIVDFRGFDTLGEITVLSIAALIVADLLRDFRPALQSPAGQPPESRRAFMLTGPATTLLPFILLVAGFLFLRGHNLPGGGFIGGLVLAAGLLLPYLAHGTAWTERRARIDFQLPVAWGLLVAGLTGVGSFLFGHPFLTSAYLAPVAPWLGKIPLPSALFFDLGVFLSVSGAALLALTTLGRVNSTASGEAA